MVFKRLAGFLVFGVVFSCISTGQTRIKVACVGNSVTYGFTIPDREVNNYPAQLGRMLGEGYEVGNFGKSGATLLNKGHRPYMEQEEFRKALQFAGDKVVIHLGLNDTDPRNWPNYRDDFIPDYLALIDSFRRVNPACQIWICRMSPIFHRHWRFKSGTRDWYWQIQQAIEKVAEDAGVGLIDLHEDLYCRPDLLHDALHPNAEGAGILAEKVYGAITGDYGGLQLPSVYSDDMVLQRGAELKIRGLANAGEEVKVSLGKYKGSGVADEAGRWEVVLNDLKAGGPFELLVATSNRKLRFQRVMIGEVWLCSGQSNMAFMVKQALEADETMAHAGEDSNVRLFDMKPRVFTDMVIWDSTDMAAVNRLDYFLPTVWKVPDEKSAGDFSAVAYYFGRMLADSLKVPVGLICNAVGGAPAEAFIDRKSLECNYQLVDILYNWTKNDMIQEWVRERAMQNLKNSNSPYQRHPYEPCYLYEAGIRPLRDFPLGGVIWYQGESNAHNVELHEALFPVLVDSWREIWGKELPFYFVQLSSINRPSWPHFRDSQRRLAERTENSGIAVSSDLGHPTDVHPIRKKEVGERLGRLALNRTYGFESLVETGPMYKNATFEDGFAYVEFFNGVGMCSSDGQPLRSFEVAGEDGLFHPATAEVSGVRVKVWSPEVKQPVVVRYGWQPYSTGNLVNAVGLPASTFSSNPGH